MRKAEIEKAGIPSGKRANVEMIGMLQAGLPGVASTHETHRWSVRSGTSAPAVRFAFYVLRPRPHVPRLALHAPRASAFTLIELLLVMTIMVTAIAIAAPTLANFFRGRTLDSEARRLLALTHSGQDRAVSEGIPTRLQVDTANHSYSLRQDPGWSDGDAKALEFPFDKELQVEVINANSSRSSSGRPRPANSFQARANPRNLPEIRFLPDGSIDDTSPRALRLQDRNGTSLWLAQATNHLSYEIRSSFN